MTSSVISFACFTHFSNTVEALVSGHPRDAMKVSVTGAGRLRGLAQLTINIGIQKNTTVFEQTLKYGTVITVKSL